MSLSCFVSIGFALDSVVIADRLPPLCATPVYPMDGQGLGREPAANVFERSTRIGGLRVTPWNLKWSPVAGVAGYYLEMGTQCGRKKKEQKLCATELTEKKKPVSSSIVGLQSHQPSNIISNQNVGLVTQYRTPHSKVASTYYWRVTPFANDGLAPVCPVWSFTVAINKITSFPYLATFDLSLDGWEVTTDSNPGTEQCVFLFACFG